MKSGYARPFLLTPDFCILTPVSLHITYIHIRVPRDIVPDEGLNRLEIPLFIEVRVPSCFVFRIFPPQLSVIHFQTIPKPIPTRPAVRKPEVEKRERHLP